MYKHELTVYGENLATDQALPQNASADGNGGVFDLAGTQGGIEIVVKVGSTAIALADTKSLTVKLAHKDRDDASFVDLATLYSKTASGATTLAVGTELARFSLPSSTGNCLKAVITTTDVSASGKLSVSPIYLAR
jgi:hypothetical protein